jgi:hypothetical protein
MTGDHWTAIAIVAILLALAHFLQKPVSSSSEGYDPEERRGQD